MVNPPDPDQPAPGEHDRTVVNKPGASKLENLATTKNAVNGDNIDTGEFAATIKNSGSVGANSAASEAALSADSRFGRYLVKRELGAGAMGAVYLALDEQLDREVAIKIPKFGPEDGPEEVERFYREARAMATLIHPNLCPVHDVGEIGGVHYLTMQFVEGRPMSDFLNGEKSHPAKTVAAVMRKLAVAMDAAHQAGIVHRDLKPANIMLDQRNEPIIMDFGLAQRRSENETTLTQTGQIMGTPSYMSPEQVRGKQDNIGPPSDIYSLGVICYQLLTGKLPFTGSLGEVMAAILTEEPERPSKINKTVNRSIEAICLKAMAKDVKKRYASAADLAKALRGYLRGERLVEEDDAKLTLSKAAPTQTTGTVNTSRKEVALADDFFADLVVEERLPPVQKRRRRGGKGRRKSKSKQVPKWAWIAGGCGAAVVLLLIVLMASKGGSEVDQVADDTGDTTKTKSEVTVSPTVKKSETPPTVPVKSVTPEPVKPVTPDVHDGQPVAAPNIAGSKAGEPRVFGADLKIDFRWCPPGQFTMGSPAREMGHQGNENQVRVTLSRGFWMGRTEVTQGQFETVMGTIPWKGKDREVENHPAGHVSWNDATEFCQTLTEREHRAGRLPAGWSYRLPTAAEWEYACRAGTTTSYSFGNDPAQLGEHAWFKDNTKNVNENYAHPVGTKKPNPWGLCDMHGNVYEWCSDWMADKLTGGRDPQGPSTGRGRERRGGAMYNHFVVCRSAFRRWSDPSLQAPDVGFRVALGPSGTGDVASDSALESGTKATPHGAPPSAVAPFDAAAAKAHQEAWAKHLGVEVETTNSIGMKMRLIPPGEFLMGSSEEEIKQVTAEARKRKWPESWMPAFPGEGPQHRVTLTRPIRLATCEVTRGQYRQFVNATGHQSRGSTDGNGLQDSGHPVVDVSWRDAVAFCEWLSKKEGVTYHLPTEAQWEFACRAGSSARFSFGDDETQLSNYAWYGGSTAMPVGKKAANAFGLFDMHGNVWEWCHDRFASYTAAPALDPVGPAQGESAWIRGGTFRHHSWLARSTTRFANSLSYSNFDIGFRVAADLPN